MGLAHDPGKVLKLCGVVHEALDVRSDLAALPPKDFAASRRDVAAAKYCLLVGIEACLDLASRLIAKNRLRPPEDYADAFRVMREKGIVEPALADRLQEMAPFRNRLVHAYTDVGTDWLAGILREDVHDLARFVDAVTKAIGQ